MLSVKIESENGLPSSCEIRASGSVPTTVADVLLVAVSLYQNYRRTNPLLADAFRNGLKGVLADNEVWDATLRPSVAACFPAAKKKNP